MRNRSCLGTTRVLVVLSLTLLALVSACGSGSDAKQVRPKGSGPVTIRVPADARTISAAVAAAHPGDLVLVSPGVYRETVRINTRNVTLRGTSRAGVVIDGQIRRANGVVVTARGVTVENLTVRNETLNGVLVTGLHDGTGGLAKGSDGYTRLNPAKFPPIQGFAVRYVTSENNGLYGIYAFDSQHGVIEQTHTSGSADSGIYVGQCRPCDIVVRGNVAELNAVGYEGTNASENVIVTGNRFSHNRVGLTSDSDYQEALVPQQQATFVGNVVADNDDPNTPAQADGGWGIGVGLAGSRQNLIARNLIVGNATVGVVLTSNEDLPPIGNRILDNALSDNGVDVGYSASTRAPGARNCMRLSRGQTTDPAGLALAMRCPAGGATAAGVTIEPRSVPAGLPFTNVRRPTGLPDMPNAVSAPWGPAKGVGTLDVTDVAVPASSLLLDQTTAR